jgi:hypothetical protein
MKLFAFISVFFLSITLSMWLFVLNLDFKNYFLIIVVERLSYYVAHVLQAFRVSFSPLFVTCYFIFNFLLFSHLKFVFFSLFRKLARFTCVFFFLCILGFMILGLCKKWRKVHSWIEHIYIFLLLFLVLEEVRVIMFHALIWHRHYFIPTSQFFLSSKRHGLIKPRF